MKWKDEPCRCEYVDAEIYIHGSHSCPYKGYGMVILSCLVAIWSLAGLGIQLFTESRLLGAIFYILPIFALLVIRMGLKDVR